MERTGDTITVLVVDDQDIFAELVARILRREPDISLVAHAETVEDAVVGVRHLMPDVVLMDHHLPDGKGTDAARRIITEFRTVRIVMLTATADDRTLAEAREAGCHGYVTKDRAAVDLAEAVRAAYRGEADVPASSLELIVDRQPRRS